MLSDKSQEQADLSISPSFLHRFSGPRAVELSLRSRPQAVDLGSVAEQTESVYRQLREALGSEGGALENVLRETVFFRNIARDMPEFRRSRERVLRQMGPPGAYAPASQYIEQPPLDAVQMDAASLEGTPSIEILVSAVIPEPSVSTEDWIVRAGADCDCPSCAELRARCFVLDGEKHVLSANIHGAPGSAYSESLSMFEMANRLLRKEGMDFRSVVRTWIYLRNMDRDYGEFNRARRDFFSNNGVEVLPASTGIDGSPLPAGHNFVMGFTALHGPRPVQKEIMTTPSLNEAPEYGSDFSRGMRVVDANKTALYISGTASVDELGATVHVEDFESQVNRMLWNVSLLLEKQQATFQDMTSAITYIKRAHDAPTFRRILHERGIRGFPNVIVEAGVCRSDLLCEIEGIALLPRES